MNKTNAVAFTNVDNIEGKSRRNYLRLHGIRGKQVETWGGTEVKVRQFIKKDLGLPGMENVQIERAHRVGNR
jgi:hypothetical protein